MRILVTGGAGFIGSHMADRLVTERHDVVVLDNEATGRRENVPLQAEYVKGDVLRPEDLGPIFADGIDAVFHIAGQVSLIRSFSNPFADLRTNVEGTVNVLQHCLQHRVPRLLYASSMTVYASTAELPTPEETPCVPSSYYGITKHAAERYVHTTAECTDFDFEFNVTSFRMYNVYGPRQALNNPYQGVLGIFLGNLLRNEPLTIFGDGEQSRDFIYISDVVDAWVSAIQERSTFGKVFNVGSGKETTINRLADMSLASLGRERNAETVRYEPGRPGEQRRMAADTTRALETYGWQARTSFKEGLTATVDWARGETAIPATDII